MKEADFTQLRVAEDWKSDRVSVPSNLFHQVLNADWPRDYVEGAWPLGVAAQDLADEDPAPLRAATNQDTMTNPSMQERTQDLHSAIRGGSSRDSASLASIPSLPLDHGAFPTSNGGTRGLKVTAYNCNGFKSAHPFVISSAQEDSDVMFLSELWLRPHEIPLIEHELREQNLWSQLNSAMDPTDCAPNPGRPYGGVGFVCKKVDGFSYRSILIENPRISALMLISHGSTVLTVFGVYLPFFNGTAEQATLYSETLDELQGLMDSCSSPFLVVGDMNASLPSGQLLSR